MQRWTPTRAAGMQGPVRCLQRVRGTGAAIGSRPWFRRGSWVPGGFDLVDLLVAAPACLISVFSRSTGRAMFPVATFLARRRLTLPTRQRPLLPALGIDSEASAGLGPGLRSEPSTPASPARAPPTRLRAAGGPNRARWLSAIADNPPEVAASGPRPPPYGDGGDLPPA